MALAEQLNVSATESTWTGLLAPPLAQVLLLFCMFLLLTPAVPSGCRFGLIPQQLRACGAAGRGHLNAVKLANVMVSLMQLSLSVNESLMRRLLTLGALTLTLLTLTLLTLTNQTRRAAAGAGNQAVVSQGS